MDIDKNILLVICCLLFMALFPMPYGYYTLLRLCVFCFAGYTFFQRYLKENFSLFNIVFLMIGLVYNPIIKIGFEKDVWICINLITLIFLLFCFFYRSENQKQKVLLPTMEIYRLPIIENVKSCGGVWDNPPDALLELAERYNDFVVELETEDYKVKNICYTGEASEKNVCVHTFSKYPQKPSKLYMEFAAKGIYIQETIDYEENITVGYFCKRLCDERFLLIDGQRTHKIDMDIFNQHITPLIERFFIDNIKVNGDFLNILEKTVA